MPRRATSHVGRRRRSGPAHRRAAPAVLRPAGGRLALTVALAAGVGVVATSALASSSSAAGLWSAVRPADVPPGTTASPATSTPMSAASSVTSTTSVNSAVPAVPGYVAASNAAVGVPGAAPAIGLAPALQKARPVVRVAGTAWVNPLPEAVVSSCYGMRWGRLHAGVDLAAPNGTPIRAAGAGVIVKAGAEEGYGNAVLIDHGNGYLTHYGHMSVVTVHVGDEVTAGQQIGDEGSTGHSTGPHLHFEVHKGFYKNPIEPTEWLHEHGVDIPGCVKLGTTPASGEAGSR